MNAFSDSNLDRDEDPRITAYALGELQGEERAAFEAELASDASLLSEVEASQDTALLLSGALAPESAGHLSNTERQELVDAIEPGKVVRFSSSRFALAAAALLAALLVLALLIGPGSGSDLVDNEEKKKAGDPTFDVTLLPEEERKKLAEEKSNALAENGQPALPKLNGPKDSIPSPFQVPESIKEATDPKTGEPSGTVIVEVPKAEPEESGQGTLAAPRRDTDK